MTDDELIEEIKGIQRIVINTKHGGFCLSEQASRLFAQRTGITYDRPCNLIARDDPVLVAIVRELGADANGDYGDLKIVEVPYEVEWQIEEYDGAEWVAEKHRTWR